MALSDDEVEQVKYYLGYTGVTAVAIGYIDFPAVFTTVLQNNLSSWAEGQVRTTILPKLLTLDSNIDAAQSRYKALEAGKVKLNPKEHQALLRLRDYWIRRLEDVTGIRRKRGNSARLALY